MPTIDTGLSLSGSLRVKLLRPRSPWLWHLENWVRYRWRELPLCLLIWSLPLLKLLVPGLTVLWGETRLRLLRRDGTWIDYGLAGRHLITTAGKNYLAGCFNNTNEAEVFLYHGFGTGTTSAAAGDTALQTELTTQYATDNVRPTGSQSVTTNVYTTVATLSPNAGGTIAVTEFGLFSQASNAGGTLFDRQVFSAVNVVASADSLQTTYSLTVG